MTEQDNRPPEPPSVQPCVKKKSQIGLVVPAGLFIGIGIGFIYRSVPAGLFLGLGSAFLLMWVATIVEDMKR